MFFRCQIVTKSEITAVRSALAKSAGRVSDSARADRNGGTLLSLNLGSNPGANRYSHVPVGARTPVSGDLLPQMRVKDLI